MESEVWVIMLKMFLILALLEVGLSAFFFWRIRRYYAARFDAFAVIVQEAMALRDKKLREIQVQLADAYTKDTRLFDGMLDDVSDILEADEIVETEEEEANEREGEDSSGTG